MSRYQQSKCQSHISTRSITLTYCLPARGALTKIESGGVCVETVAANADVHLRRVGDSRLSFYFWQHGSESAQLLQVHCRSLYRRLSALVLVVAYDEPNLSRLLNELFSAYFAEVTSTNQPTNQ